MKFEVAVNKITNSLARHKPRKIRSAGLIPSAVLIPFFNKEDQAHVLFTVRTDDVEHHKGQISFPGGAREAQDRSLQDTALRECHEEIGVPPEEIHVLGRLDDFPTITDFLVTPFVATLPYPYPFKINTKEVAEIIKVPLALFLNDTHFEIKEWKHGEKTYPVFFYYFNHHVIWGATAFILNRFIEMVFAYNPAPQSVIADLRHEQYLDENIHRKGVADE